MPSLGHAGASSGPSPLPSLPDEVPDPEPDKEPSLLPSLDGPWPCPTCPTVRYVAPASTRTGPTVNSWGRRVCFSFPLPEAEETPLVPLNTPLSRNSAVAASTMEPICSCGNDTEYQGERITTDDRIGEMAALQTLELDRKCRVDHPL